MTVLVTGGAGYIGSHIVQRLIQRNRDVVVLDNLQNGFRRAVLNAPLEIGDIRDEDFVRKVCRVHRVEAVIHMAALKSVGESMNEPHRYFEWNVSGSVRLTRAVMEAGVRHIVFSSSASVYGEVKPEPISESEPTRPMNVYAMTKANVENYLLSCRPLGLRSISLRYFNAAGSSMNGQLGEDWDCTHNLIPRLMKATLTGKEVFHLFGDDYPTPDGTCIRDFVHVDDLAEAHLKALDYVSSGGDQPHINIGTGVGVSVRDVIDLAEEVSGKKVPLQRSGRRQGDPSFLVADPSLAESELNWKSRYSIRDIVKSSFDWYVANPMGYQG